MRQMKIAVVWVMAAVTLCFACGAWAQEDPRPIAAAAAQAWLALIDNGQYGASWETAAAYFKNTITKEYWQQSISAIRKPLGRLVARELRAGTYTRSLPGAPDGEYVVLQFLSSFENKKTAIERVIPMLDKDGIWRVSGYYLE